MKNLTEKGGKGMLPTCCLLPRGREGVTLPSAAENKRITLKKEDFNKAEIVYYSPLINYRPAASVLYCRTCSGNCRSPGALQVSGFFTRETGIPK
jgi:hypothetical protein